MKKKLLFLAGMLFSGVASQAQWVSQPFTFGDPYQVAYYLDAVDNNVAWAAGFDIYENTGSTQVARTFNSGTNWTVSAITNLGAGETITGIAGLSASTALVCTAYETGRGRILKTTNAGATWTVQSSATQFSGAASFPNYIAFFNATEGICAGDPSTTGKFEIYTTADAGTTWTAVPAANIPALVGDEFSVINRFALVGNSFWFATTEGRVFRSADKGQTWAASVTGLAAGIPYLSFRDAANGLAIQTAELGSNAHSVVRTTNGGATWQALAYTGPLHGYIDNVPGTTSFISVGLGNDVGSSYSRDNGTTWTALESSLHHATVDAVSATTAWSSAVEISELSGLGVYKLNSTVLGTAKDVALQRGLSVYPNPSTGGQFKVALGTKLTTTAQVAVSDAMGRTVYTRTLQPATATAQFDLDLGRPAAGVYTLQISSESGVAQQKIVVQ